MADLQKEIETKKVKLIPLRDEDFEELYLVASDPKIWEQHPNNNRWQKEIFKTFFEGAIKSQGAFKIVDKASDKVIGSTRFYDYDSALKSIHIGYTFYATAFWGAGYNHEVKIAMLNYIFQFVSKVIFHIGSENIRSQIAISRLGALKTGEQIIPYFGEAPINNFIFEIQKEAWQKNRM